MPAGFYATVPPILGEPSPHGLLGGCIEVVNDRDMHVFNGTQTLSQNCADSNVWYQCDARPGSPTPDNPASKTFDRPKQCSYEPVTVYAGLECNAIGLTYDEGQARVLEQLRLGEQAALEKYLMEQVLCGEATGNDLTPAAGALSVAQAVGVLEGWLAQNYGGQGVLHVPAGAAALLSHGTLVDFGTEEQCPQTLMGNSIVLGAGYQTNVGPATPPATGCVTAPQGEMWLYITPPMRIRRDDRVLADMTGQGVNTSTNDRRVLAETTFVPEIACCMAAAVRAKIC